MAAWLVHCRIRSVAMESTGVYWIPPYEILEEAGFGVCLVNSRYVRHVPGRKSDVSVCQWLQYLHSVGLLKPSFRPQGAVCAMSALTPPSRRASGQRGGAHPAHAQGAHPDESADSPRFGRHHRPQRHGHPGGHRRRRARSRAAGRACAMAWCAATSRRSSPC